MSAARNRRFRTPSGCAPSTSEPGTQTRAPIRRGIVRVSLPPRGREDYGSDMSADTAGAQYVAEFIDGPLEGDFEHRILVSGKPEKRVGMVAAVDGLESLFWYDAVDEHQVNGQLRVRFRFDAGDSDPVEFDEDNND